MKPIYYALAALDNALICKAKYCGQENLVDMQICKENIYKMVAKGYTPVFCEENYIFEIIFENENGVQKTLQFICPESESIAREFFDVFTVLDENNICLACN